MNFQQLYIIHCGQLAKGYSSCEYTSIIIVIVLAIRCENDIVCLVYRQHIYNSVIFQVSGL